MTPMPLPAGSTVDIDDRRLTVACPAPPPASVWAYDEAGWALVKFLRGRPKEVLANLGHADVRNQRRIADVLWRDGQGVLATGVAHRVTCPQVPALVFPQPWEEIRRLVLSPTGSWRPCPECIPEEAS